jgi:hypothetical protein
VAPGPGTTTPEGGLRRPRTAAGAAVSHRRPMSETPVTSGSDRSLTFVTLGGFGLLLAAIAILVVTPPAQRYEISIYAALPLYFWLLLASAFLVGSIVMLASAQRPGDRSWRPALALMLLTNAALLALPYVRGYRMYGRGDALTHIGIIRDIGQTGAVATNNIYPNTHLLIRTVSYVTDTDPMVFAVLVPAVLTGVYFGSMYYLLVHLYGTREEVLFRLPFTMLPILGAAHVGVRPFDLAVLLTPLVLYLFVKSQRNPKPTTRVAFVAVVISYVMWHPLSAVFLLSVFCLWAVAKHASLFRAEYPQPTNVVSLMSVSIVVWYHHYTSIIFRFDTVLTRLLGTARGTAPIDQYSETVESASPPLVDLFRVWLFSYGVEFVVFGLGFGFLCLVAYFLYREAYAIDSYVVLVGGILVAFSFGGLVFLTQDLIVGVDRPFQFAKIGGVVLAGGVFSLIWRYLDARTSGLDTRVGFDASVVAVLLVLVLLTTFTLYPSPAASTKNHQVTRMELSGVEWLSDHSDGGSDIYAVGMNYWRYHQGLNGTEGEFPLVTRHSPPDHFNYTTYDTYGQSVGNDSYLVVTRLGRVVYPKKFPDYRSFWRFTPRDFDRLDRDPTVDRVYDNGDVTLYSVDSTAPETES